MPPSFRLFPASALLFCTLAGALAAGPLEMSTRREIFVDDFLIASLKNAALRLHEPRDEGPVLNYDLAWEGPFCGYDTILLDGGTYRLYYRGKAGGADGSGEVTCYAESNDGIHWIKPKLGLYPADGSTQNNIILNAAGVTHNFSPFLDSRPGVPHSERFKALGGVIDHHNPAGGLRAYASGDGIHWTPFHPEPVMTKGAFDSQNISFWSAAENGYVCFFRTFTGGVTTATEWKAAGLRTVSRATSPDFIHWSEAVPMRFEPPQETHLYISQTQPYFRAPHLYIATGARFMEGRQALSAEEAAAIKVSPNYFKDASDTVLLSSRDGRSFQQTFRGALIRPGLRHNEWTSRTGYPALNVVPTGAEQMSLFVNQDYAQPTAHLRRYSMRTDGFASVHAPYEGGEFTTKTLRFEGRELEINFATSAAGGIRVEIQDEAGVPVPGYAAADCKEILGNRIAGRVQWKSGKDVSKLAGQTVRLRFLMKDADLFALQFVP